MTASASRPESTSIRLSLTRLSAARRNLLAGSRRVYLFLSLILVAVLLLPACGSGGDTTDLDRSFDELQVIADQSRLERGINSGADLVALSRALQHDVENAQRSGSISKERARGYLEDGADTVAGTCGYCADLLNSAAASY